MIRVIAIRIRIIIFIISLIDSFHLQSQIGADELFLIIQIRLSNKSPVIELINYPPADYPCYP